MPESTDRSRKVHRQYAPGTHAIHSGDAKSGAAQPERSVATPIYQTTTFRFQSIAELAAQVRGENDLHMYTRYSHPNHASVEARLAAMEGAEAVACFASGMAAATTTALALCRQGDNVVSFRDIYGGTYKLVSKLLPRFGVTCRFVPTGDIAAMEAAVDGRTRLLIGETPTNPLVQIVDLELMADLGRRRRVLTMIDNTFATPINQQPHAFGIDLVWHSGTKYLGGHSDVMAGIVCGPRDLVAQIHETYMVVGGVLDPHAAFLLERGMKSLGARIARHNANAMALAELMAAHPNVAKVHYPGLRSHIAHDVAARQMRGFGGMLAMDLKGGLASAERFCAALRLGVLAVSLGAVETLVSPPALTSHVALTSDERAALGISDGTLRVSVGIEETDDLVADFTQALDSAGN